MNETPTSDTLTLSPAIEDYLKAIYHLQQEQGPVPPLVLARHLDIASPSVSTMLQKLAKLDLVTYTPYHGVALTAQGHQRALMILRHHRLIELFLVKTLGYSWEEVHVEAEVLEHVLSEKLEARIAEYLGHPTTDPHGDPIPAPDGTFLLQPTMALACLPTGNKGRIVRVRDQNPEHLQYLAALGLIPGAEVHIQHVAPFEGPVTVVVGETAHPLDRRLAQAILVGVPEGAHDDYTTMRLEEVVV